jgi:hypothetical protein
MRVLRRHPDEDAVVDSDGGSEADRTVETPRTTETQPAVGDERPGFRQRFRRSTTVPVTVPRRSIRRTARIPGRRVEQASGTTWDLAPILAIGAGAALAVVGIVTVIRTGINDTWFRPTVEVLDANHTPLLGAIEIGAGALLLLLGLAGSRLLVAVAGIAGALLGTAAAVEPEELSRELAIESWWAWTLAAAGVVLTLVALYEPRSRARGDTVIDVT